MRSTLVVLLCVAACGDDDGVNKLPDAPVFQDAPADAATSGVVTLTITQGTTPAMGVRVYFQNADSSVVSATMTDANGVASATMEPGGFVTAIDPFTTIVGTSDLRTFAGVKPGDKLVLHQAAQPGTVSFTLALPVDPNASRYLLFAPCAAFFDVTDTDGSGGNPGPGGPISLTGCDATTDILIVVTDVNGQPITSLHEPNVALVEGGTLDFTAATYVPALDATWSYQNVPAAYGSVNVDSFLADPHGTVFETFTSAAITSGTGTTTAVKRPDVAGALQIDLASFFGLGFGTQQVLEWGPPTPAHVTSLGNLLNPNLLVPDYTADPVYDFATHSITWQIDTTGGGKQPDFALANMNLSRGGTQFWQWQIAAPNTAPAVAYPVLPGADAIFNPIDTDSLFIFELTTARVPNGYDAVRANVLSLDSPVGLVVGATGQVVLEQYQRGKARKRGPIGRLRSRVKSTR